MEKISIRTKNVDKLSDAAKTAIETVLKTPEAEMTVFRVQYALEEVISELNLDLAGEEKDTFASELRYQFSKLFPDEPRKIEVTKGIIFESETSPAFKNLRDKLTAFSAYRILDKILEYAHFELEDIERTGYLLRFKPLKETATEAFLERVERNNFGGLRSLLKNRNGGVDESRDIAKWLKEYVEDVSILFDEVMGLKYPSYNSPKESAEAKPVTITSTPVEVVKVAKVAEEAPSEEPEDIATAVTLQATEIPAEEHSSALTSQQVVTNKELIKSFFVIKAKLWTAGITPEMLESQKGNVINLLNALDNF